MASNSLSDIKLGMSVGMDDAWRGVGLPQVAIHRKCHISRYHRLLPDQINPSLKAVHYIDQH